MIAEDGGLRGGPPMDPPLHSYAQNSEDVWLFRAFGSGPAGTYVDIGAFDPEQNSVTRMFYDLGWNGVNVEPGPRFGRFTAARPRDVNLQLALGSRAGSLLWIHDHGAPGRPLIPKDASESYEDLIAPVPMSTLAAVLDEHMPRSSIQFMRVDGRGDAEAILGGNDWTRYRPKIVLVADDESTKESSGEPGVGILSAAGYLEAYFDGVNRFFVRAEDSELVDVFAIPVNPSRDGFVRANPALERDLERLRGRVAELEDKHQRLLVDLVPPGDSRTLRYGLGVMRWGRHAYWGFRRLSRLWTWGMKVAQVGLRSDGGTIRSDRPRSSAAAVVPPILVDVTEASGSLMKTGIQRVVSSLCREWPDHRIGLVRVDRTGSFQLLHPAGERSVRELFVGVQGSRTGRATGYRLSEEELRDRIVICPEMFTEPYRLQAYQRLIARLPNGVFFVVHDLIPLRHQGLYDSGSTREFADYVKVISRASNIAFVSDAVREDFSSSVARASRPNFVTVELGADGMGVRRPPTTPPPPTFVTLGTVEPRKNHGLILEAFDELRTYYRDLELMVISQKEWLSPVARDLRRRAESDAGVVWLRGAGDRDVAYAVSRARATICASSAEGFGLPVVESLALGVPAIAPVDVPSVASVGCRGIIPIRKLDGRGVAAAMELALSDVVWGQKVEEIRSRPFRTWRDFGRDLADWIDDSLALRRRCG